MPRRTSTAAAIAALTLTLGACGSQNGGSSTSGTSGGVVQLGDLTQSWRSRRGGA